MREGRENFFKVETQAAACLDEGNSAKVNPVIERAFRDVQAAGKFVDVDEFDHKKG
jgi:hypothetical protein